LFEPQPASVISARVAVFAPRTAPASKKYKKAASLVSAMAVTAPIKRALVPTPSASEEEPPPTNEVACPAKGAPTPANVLIMPVEQCAYTGPPLRNAATPLGR
jgi:hypothetical protein